MIIYFFVDISSEYLIDLLNRSIDNMKFRDVGTISQLNELISKIKSGEIIFKSNLIKSRDSVS